MCYRFTSVLLVRCFGILFLVPLDKGPFPLQMTSHWRCVLPQCLTHLNGVKKHCLLGGSSGIFGNVGLGLTPSWFNGKGNFIREALGNSCSGQLQKNNITNVLDFYYLLLLEGNNSDSTEQDIVEKNEQSWRVNCFLWTVTFSDIIE